MMTVARFNNRAPSLSWAWLLTFIGSTVSQLVLSGCVSSDAWAQSPERSSGVEVRTTQTSNDAVKSPLRGHGSARGGASTADFSQLMMLIQQTIDPTDWLDGSSVLSPFPAGVYIDPAGQLKHLSPHKGAHPVSLKKALSELHKPWQIESTLRIVSLRKLDQAIGEVAAKGGRITAELQRLASLTRIEYVHIDVANEDVWLAGPAMFGQPGLPQGFHLADLGLLVELINSRSSPLGCSIDPTEAGIVAAQQLLTPAGALKRLAHNPKRFVEQMEEKIGPHHVRIFGMPANSPAAMALLLADEHMKQLGFEKAQTPVPVDSYFDHLDRQPQVPTQSLVRWWFAFANESIVASQHGDLFQLPKQCVQLYSEQQWVSLTGMQPTGEQDVAADAFAQGMTDGLDDLRQVHPAYARMCALFETALALQLSLETNGQPNLHAWFPNLRQYGQTACDAEMEPKSVSGLTAWHKQKQGTVVAVVSGGVRIDGKALASPDRWQQATIAVDLPPTSTRDEIGKEGWWWD